ncbi:MAG TPA: hypothetical protein VFU69_17585, partial [Ktedonobacterales bacterium]|nr:hypothetical protein [Ktedonobacterales bacterium]
MSVFGEAWRLPAVGKAGVEALGQTPMDWLTVPARDCLRRWLENRKTRKQLIQALDDALEALAETLAGASEVRSLDERFFSDRQVMGTLAACFTSDEPVDYALLARKVALGGDAPPQRILQALVAQLRAHLAAANPEFRLHIPVQSAARVQAIQSARQTPAGDQHQAQPAQHGSASPAPAAPQHAATVLAAAR